MAGFNMYRIKLVGCDDETTFDMHMTPREAQVVEQLSKLSFENGGGCQPVLEMRLLDEEPK